MSGRHADRLWIFCGAALILVLAMLSWFLVINPKYAEADQVRSTAADTELKILSLKKRIGELERQKADLPQFKRALARNRNALPADSGVPDFLRQLQSSGDALDVTVGGINLSQPVLVDGSTTVYCLPMTLTAQGTAGSLASFLRGLQATQPRAVLIESANLTPAGGAGATGRNASAEVSVSLSLKAFVAVPAGAGAPIVTAAK